MTPGQDDDHHYPKQERHHIHHHQQSRYHGLKRRHPWCNLLPVLAVIVAVAGTTGRLHHYHVVGVHGYTPLMVVPPFARRRPLSSSLKRISSTTTTTTTATTAFPVVFLKSTRLNQINGNDNDEGDSDDEPGGDFASSSFSAVAPEPFQSEADMARAANELLVAATISNNNKNDHDIELQAELQNSFLQYALSIILGRALPDARDGLKPVHRRILYSMHRLNLSPQSTHRKCARVVGEVLGKYHPHGDQAVYDALVRMAQDFSTHYRLVDGHGNFGSVDADPAAAMRYTECKLTALAVNALGLCPDELDADTVDWIPNFDGNESEPTVLPAKLPLLLLNGSSGIAVGMATNIPPHNLREILAACRALIQQERLGDSSNSRAVVDDDQLAQLVPGPDFPTGATLMGTGASQQLYRTGNGGVTLRAVTHVEQLKVRTAIVVTELPYQVNKAALLEHMAGLVNDKKLDGIADLRDESDRDGIRVVLELKRDAAPAIVLNNLFKKTKLQTVFSGNFVALMRPKTSAGGTVDRNGGVIENRSLSALTPQRFTLREALNYFLDFRFETLRRRTAFQLEKVQARTHIVDGLLLALSRVDDIIEAIRQAPDVAAVRQVLMMTDQEETKDASAGSLRLGLSREQADSVLRLQLGQLTRLNQDKLESEKADLESQSDNLNLLMRQDEAVYNVMLEEFDEIDDKYGTDRKTIILSEEGEVNEMDMIKNSRSVVVVTRGGYIKRMPLKVFESQNRGTRGKRGTSADSSTTSSLASKDDYVLHCITCNDHDTLLMITQNGIAYGLPTYQVPTASRTAKGTPLPSVLPIEIGQVVTAVLPVPEFVSESYIVLATQLGMIKKTPLNAFGNISSRGLTIASLGDGDKLKWCHKCTDQDDLLISSSRAMAVRFPSVDLRPTGRTSRGVKAMKLKDGDTIADMNVIRGMKEGYEDEEETGNEFVLCITERGFGKRVATNAFRSASRGNMGVIAAKFKKQTTGRREDRMSCFTMVKEDDEILAITAKGIMVRQKVSQIPVQSRTATGVVVQKVDDTDYIASVSLVPKTLEEEENL